MDLECGSLPEGKAKRRATWRLGVSEFILVQTTG